MVQTGSLRGRLLVLTKSPTPWKGKAFMFYLDNIYLLSFNYFQLFSLERTLTHFHCLLDEIK